MYVSGSAQLLIPPLQTLPNLPLQPLLYWLLALFSRLNIPLTSKFASVSPMFTPDPSLLDADHGFPLSTFHAWSTPKMVPEGGKKRVFSMHFSQFGPGGGRSDPYLFIYVVKIDSSIPINRSCWYIMDLVTWILPRWVMMMMVMAPVGVIYIRVCLRCVFRPGMRCFGKVSKYVVVL